MNIKFTRFSLKVGRIVGNWRVPFYQFNVSLFSFRLIFVWSRESFDLFVSLGDKYRGFEGRWPTGKRLVKWWEYAKFRIKHSVFRRPIYVEFWSRDCDCVEGSYTMKIVGVRKFDKLVAQFYEEAEGECHVYQITEEDYKNFEPHYRDRVTEAYENGNSYLV